MVDTRGEDDCWPWTRFVGNRGQGIFYYNKGNNKINANRAAWYMTNGHIHNGSIYLLCGNKSCCNPKHMGIKRATPPEYFWANVSILSTDECWEWIGHKSADGYGVMHFSMKPWLAHRLAWYLTCGEIADGLCVCHRCDNPGCCNPNHLFLGTVHDNNIDRDTKGRHHDCRGELNPFSKLTCKDVVKIRATKGLSQIAIASEYGVSKSLISLIKRGKAWNHIE